MALGAWPTMSMRWHHLGLGGWLWGAAEVGSMHNELLWRCKGQAQTMPRETVVKEGSLNFMSQPLLEEYRTMSKKWPGHRRGPAVTFVWLVSGVSTNPQIGANNYK